MSVNDRIANAIEDLAAKTPRLPCDAEFRVVGIMPCDSNLIIHVACNGEHVYQRMHAWAVIELFDTGYRHIVATFIDGGELHPIADTINYCTADKFISLEGQGDGPPMRHEIDKAISESLR